MLDQLQRQARNPLRAKPLRVLERLILPRLLTMPAFFCTLVLAAIGRFAREGYRANSVADVALSLLMSMLPTGTDAITLASRFIAAVFDAALSPPTVDR